MQRLRLRFSVEHGFHSHINRRPVPFLHARRCNARLNLAKSMPRGDLSSLPMRAIAAVFGVLALVMSGYLIGMLLASRSGSGWDPGKAYAIWCIAAEVAPCRINGEAWDFDGSPPDLSAEILWRGNRVLVSATSRDTLLATWDRASFRISDLFRTEFRPGDLDKVARIKADASERITISIHDSDILGSETAGTATIPLACLKEGVNRVNTARSGSALRSVTLRVVSVAALEGGGQLPETLNEFTIADGKDSN